MLCLCCCWFSWSVGQSVGSVGQVRSAAPSVGRHLVCPAFARFGRDRSNDKQQQPKHIKKLQFKIEKEEEKREDEERQEEGKDP